MEKTQTNMKIVDEQTTHDDEHKLFQLERVMKWRRKPTFRTEPSPLVAEPARDVDPEASEDVKLDEEEDVKSELAEIDPGFALWD